MADAHSKQVERGEIEALLRYCHSLACIPRRRQTVNFRIHRLGGVDARWFLFLVPALTIVAWFAYVELMFWVTLALSILILISTPWKSSGLAVPRKNPSQSSEAT